MRRPLPDERAAGVSGNLNDESRSSVTATQSVRLSRRGFLAGAGALGALATTTLLAGCSTGTAISNDPDELVLWYWNRSLDPEFLKRAAKGIPGQGAKRLRPDLIGGASYDTKFRTALAGNAFIPDVLMINSNCWLYFPDEELFTDFRPTEAERSGYYDWKLSLGRTPSGRQCFWPVDTGPTGFFYNQEVLRKADLPTDPDEVGAAISTWSDFRDFGEQIKRKTGAATIITATQLFNQFIAASPTRYFDRDDQPLYQREDSAVRKAWENAVESIHAAITGNLQSGTDQNAGWVAGRVAGQIEGAWWTQIIHDTAPDLSGKWRIAKQPERPGNSGGSFLAVPKSSKDPEAAVAFAKWITQPEIQSHTYNDIQLFPSTPASFTNGLMRNPGDYFGDQDPLDFFSDAAPEVPVTYISNRERFVGAFATEITNVESTGKDPERAWRDAVDQTDRVLAKRGVAA